jgi:hypothetical protein
MSAYADELRRVAERLDLPQPVRARVVLELASDLSDLEAELVAGGEPVAAARERAVRTLVPSDEALGQLLELHRPLYRRVADRFSDPLRHRGERLALAVVSSALFVVGMARLAGAGLLSDASRAVAPLLAIALAVVTVSVWKGFQLRVRGDHDVASLRSGMWVLPLAAVLGTLVALGGSALDLYGVAGRLEADVAGQAAELLAWLRRGSALLGLGLLVTSLALGLWLVLEAGIARVEQAEMSILAGIAADSPGSHDPATERSRE